MMYQPQKIYQAWKSQVEIDLRNGLGYSSLDRAIGAFEVFFAVSVRQI